MMNNNMKFAVGDILIWEASYTYYFVVLRVFGNIDRLAFEYFEFCNGKPGNIHYVSKYDAAQMTTRGLKVVASFDTDNDIHESET